MAGLKPGGALLASALILAMALLPGVGAMAPPQSAARPTAPPAAVKPDVHALGTFSCSARGCHGGISEAAEGVSRIRRNEFTTWTLHDKHAGAYGVLLNARSRGIAEKLGRAAGKTVPAHEDARCLACHSTPSTVSPTGGLSALRTEGVSCEACHGSASAWIEPHLQTGWASRSADRKRRAGMTPTESLTDRVAMCAGCHVGAPAGSGGAVARDVNHDLIAAGHPRLAFEFSWFQQEMPSHWRTGSDPASGVAGQARAWAVGQVEAARAALLLLQDRASDPGRPWPEFAEYDCFACHHDLDSPSWRQQASYYKGRKPGSPPWGTWTTALLPDILAGSSPIPHAGGSALLDGLDSLRDQMSRPHPDRREAAGKAAELAARLEAAASSLATAQLDASEVSNWLGAFLQGDPAGGSPGWARDTQRYLAVLALWRASKAGGGGGQAPRIEDFLRQAAESLRFETSFNSPNRYGRSAPSTAREGGHGRE